MLCVLPMPGHLGEWATSSWNVGQLTIFQVSQYKSLGGQRGSPTSWTGVQVAKLSPPAHSNSRAPESFPLWARGVGEGTEGGRAEGRFVRTLPFVKSLYKTQHCFTDCKTLQLLPLKILLFIMKTASQAIMCFLHPGHWKHFKQCWQQ